MTGVRRAPAAECGASASARTEGTNKTHFESIQRHQHIRVSRLDEAIEERTDAWDELDELAKVVGRHLTSRRRPTTHERPQRCVGVRVRRQWDLSARGVLARADAPAA